MVKSYYNDNKSILKFQSVENYLTSRMKRTDGEVIQRMTSEEEALELEEEEAMLDTKALVTTTMEEVLVHSKNQDHLLMTEVQMGILISLVTISQAMEVSRVRIILERTAKPGEATTMITTTMLEVVIIRTIMMPTAMEVTEIGD